MFILKEAISDTDYLIGADLFKEYAAHIGVDLKFQNFKEEIENLHLLYARPKGVLILAFNGPKIPIGCFAIRCFNGSICELKRMYLNRNGRGKGYGKILLAKAKELALELGYTRMRLDTLPTMTSAISLYTNFGFYEIEPYRFNPIEGSKFMELRLI